MACYTLYEKDNYQNLGGYIEQMGQRTSVVITGQTESMNGKFCFDQKSGHLIDMKKTGKLEFTMSMVIQGGTATGQTDSETEASIQLISP